MPWRTTHSSLVALINSLAIVGSRLIASPSLCPSTGRGFVRTCTRKNNRKSLPPSLIHILSVFAGGLSLSRSSFFHTAVATTASQQPSRERQGEVFLIHGCPSQVGDSGTARKQSTDDNDDRRLLGGVSIGVYRSNLLPAINPVSVSSQLGWLLARLLACFLAR